MAFLVLNETSGKKAPKLWGANSIDLRISTVDIYFGDTRCPTVGVRQGWLHQGYKSRLPVAMWS